MTRFSISGAAFALSLSTAAFAAADCCKEGADCCEKQAKQSCCDDMKHDANAGHDMSSSPNK